MPRKLDRHALPDGRLTEAQYGAALARVEPLLRSPSRAPVMHMLVEAYVVGLRDAAQVAPSAWRPDRKLVAEVIFSKLKMIDALGQLCVDGDSIQAAADAVLALSDAARQGAPLVPAELCPGRTSSFQDTP